MAIKQLIFIILVFQSTLPGLYAQRGNDLNISIGPSVTIGLISAHNEGIQAGAYGAGVGIYSYRKYVNNTFIFAGIQCDYQKIKNYTNHVVYTSNWINGTEQTKVKLHTDIDQVFIKLPLVFGWQLSPSFYGGLGFEVVSLISSRTNQEAKGEYVAENYPDDGEILTATIKYEYKIANEKNNAAFPRFNIAPCLSAGYDLSELLGIRYLLTYDLLSSPVVESRFNKYNLIRNQIVLTIKLK